MGWFIWIILGGLAGFIAEKLMKAEMGLIANIVLGIIGACFFNFLLGFFGIVPANEFFVQGAVAVAGACLLIYIYRAFKGRAA